jgi:hypothetical protein
MDYQGETQKINFTMQLKKSLIPAVCHPLPFPAEQRRHLLGNSAADFNQG